MVMRRLTLEGVSPADAAKIAVATPVTDDGRTMHTPADGYDLSFLDSTNGSTERVASEPLRSQSALIESSPADAEDRPDPRQDIPRGSQSVPDEGSDLWPDSSVESPTAVSGAAVRGSDGLYEPDEPDDLTSSGGGAERFDSAPESSDWRGVLRSVGSERSTAGGGRVVAMPDATPQNRGLARAAMSLDTYETHRILTEAIRRQGVVPIWDSMIMPVLRALGERNRATGDGIDVEHAFSEVILGVLRAVVFSVPQPRVPVNVLLACADSEYHSLPMHAVAAALAERGIPSRMLGSGLPPSAVAAAVRRTGPSVIMVYARMSGTVASETEQLRRQRPAPTVILAGPGWQSDTIPPYARTAMTLIDARDEILRALHA
jgi:hypothetical protein